MTADLEAKMKEYLESVINEFDSKLHPKATIYTKQRLEKIKADPEYHKFLNEYATAYSYFMHRGELENRLNRSMKSLIEAWKKERQA